MTSSDPDGADKELTRVAAAYAAIASVGRPEVWVEVRAEVDVVAEMANAEGPLAGLLVAVKNNVDVADLQTTAGCPSYAQEPAAADAPAVARLRAAGGTVLGSTNLDQFATGLVGQRSPYGGVRDARRPTHVSGGSSAGSAVAVALGLVDVAVGTDTAGSGRVPAALQGVVGIKPTVGVVSVEGVVPACRSWDTVTVMARDPGTAAQAMGVMAGGPGTRPWPASFPLAAPPAAHVAIPAELPGLSPSWAGAFATAVERLQQSGCRVMAIPFDTFLAAARLLYDGGLVAERHAAVGEFVDAHPEEVDPTVGAIIRAAGGITASTMVRDLDRLARLRTEAMGLLDGHHALLVPTAPGHPTIDAVVADPVGVNSWLGTYTNFCNLFDLCAVSVPSGTIDGAQFGVTVVARPFHDMVALDLAELLHLPAESVAAGGAAAPRIPAAAWPLLSGARAHEVFVVGAHLPGQPLEHEMHAVGARWRGPARTATDYRLLALDTRPRKPGLVRVRSGGEAVVGGLWQMSSAALGDFLAALPNPMTLGQVVLDDGRSVVGFTCETAAMDTAVDITSHGGWVAFLESNP